MAALRDDRGFTTVGMVIALLLCLALVFTSAQVYRVSSIAAEIQEVADAAALAAQNEVAEYLVIVRTCDALVLSMSLLGVTAYGSGIAALCVPSAQGLGKQLVELGEKVFKARDRFADTAAEGLERLQSALPFLAAASAASVASANSGPQGSYCALAVLVPLTGEPLVRTDAASASDELAAGVETGADELSLSAAAAEEAAKEIQEAKERAFQADCGAYPGYCLCERSASLAGLGASQNPLYRSVDAWSFSVALERARAYYASRHEQEAPVSQSVQERANSAIRKHYYAYAVEQMELAYVRESEDAFAAHFPVMPANTAELRSSALYDAVLWPVTSRDGVSVAHAWSGCPAAGVSAATASLRQIEQGGYAVCESCQFSAASVGKVAAASSSIANGFEYHYRIIAQAAEEYERGFGQMSSAASAAKSTASQMFDLLGEALSAGAEARIEAVPPGSLGVVAIVVGSGGDASDGFASSFVPDGGPLGVRVAVSGATMVEEQAGEGRSVIASLLDGLSEQGGGATSAARLLLSCWSRLLETYGAGQDSLIGGVETALGGVPLVSASGLGTWAANELRSLVEQAGLQPANLNALKSVVIDTGYVIERDDGAFSQRLAAAKGAAAAASTPSGDTFASLLAVMGGVFSDGIDGLEEGFEVARVEIPGLGIEVPLTIALPESLGQRARDALGGCLDAVASAYARAADERVWQ